jgi:hypothetical protein
MCRHEWFEEPRAPCLELLNRTAAAVAEHGGSSIDRRCPIIAAVKPLLNTP